MFNRILVPVDFTAKNQAALETTLNLARQNSAHVVLLHVIETIDYASGPDIEQFYDSLENQAEAELERLAAQFVEAGVPVEREIVYGRRVKEIVQFALDRQADLVVLSSHKIDLTTPGQSWGTLSYQASILCQCPVLLVK